MKLSSSLFAIAFSLVSIPLAAQGRGMEFFVSGSRNVRSIENKLQYQILPFKGGLISISSLSDSEKRIKFNQSNRLSRLNMDMSFITNRFKHTIFSGYEYQYDSSNLEEELSPYSNRTGSIGYGIAYEPIDSLNLQAGIKGYVRREQDRYMSEHILGSEGYSYYASGSAALTTGILDGSVRAGVEGKDMDWEKYYRSSVRADLSLSIETLQIQNGISLDHQTDDLYVLGNDLNLTGSGMYQLSDVQTRNSLSYNAFAVYNPDIPLTVQLVETFSQRITDFRNNLVRSNADYINLAELKMDYLATQNLSFQGRASHTFAIKDFNYNRNTRHSDFRVINTSASWEYLPGDSLVVSYGLELMRTSYPDDNNRWDNDLLTSTMRVGNVHYYRDRIRLQTWIAYSRKDDVYIKAVLSSNNKTVQSISLQPDCTLVIGDRIAFRQGYNIRADYTDFMYEGNVAGLYRQLGCKYNLTFDSFPYIARSGDPVWLRQSYRGSSENAFLAELGFAYEKNEYADKIADYYSIVSKNRKYSLSLLLKHDIRALYYIIEPKYTWGTWTEYSLLLGLAWQFNNQSMLEISVNPIGENPDELDWRSNLSLTLQF